MKFNIVAGFIIFIGIFTVFTIWLFFIDVWQTNDEEKIILVAAIGLVGAIVGGVISGLLTLYGVRLTLISQFEKEEKKRHNENRTYLSASTHIFNFEESNKISRLDKHRLILTEDYKNLLGTINKVTYYSITRYGGSQVITDCHFKITVGADTNFEKVDVVEAWIDYFEVDEELLIPICSQNLKMLNPYVKEIQATFYTLNNDKAEFIQSELENTRYHTFFHGESQQKIGFSTKHTGWLQK